MFRIIAVFLILIVFQCFVPCGLCLDRSDEKLRHYAHQKRQSVLSEQLLEKKKLEQAKLPSSVKPEPEPDSILNVSDPAVQRAMQTYKRIIPCLLKNPRAHSRKLGRLTPPVDAKEHYLDLLDKTSIFRGIPYHKYGVSSGPWIENRFIHHFINKPFEYFNGFVPLFIQFVDINCYDMTEYTEEHPRNFSIPSRAILAEKLTSWLRKDVIYLVVSQDDQGIGSALAASFPNILVFSAGGFGHIPIPLISGNLPFRPPAPGTKYAVDIGFYGDRRPGLARYHILMEVQQLAQQSGMSYRHYQGDNWVKWMLETKYNMCPRGFGRTSFRLSEVIQSGRIPVHAYDDENRWLPYEGSNISIEALGYVGCMGRMVQVVSEMKSTSDEKYSQKLEAVRLAREYFTYEGVLRQIEAFIQLVPDTKGDPEEARRAGVYLRCERVLDSDH